MPFVPTRIFPPGRRGRAPHPRRMAALERMRVSPTCAGGTDVLVATSWSSARALFAEGSPRTVARPVSVRGTGRVGGARRESLRRHRDRSRGGPIARARYSDQPPVPIDARSYLIREAARVSLGHW